MEEKVLIEGVANPLSKHNLALKNGHGVLTNKRFIFCKHNIAKILAIGIWVNLTKGDYDYDIPIEKIVKAEVISKGIRGDILYIYTDDGNVHKYGILKAVDWKIAFSNALSGHEQSQDKAPQPAADVQKNFCSNCGGKLSEADKFCPNCGAKI
jgi:hypothetical protein